MEQLPQELINIICTFSTRNHLKQNLTISRSFQHASERASRGFAEFRLSRDNASELLNLYRGRCWQYLRHVRYKITLPPYYGRKLIDDGHEKSHRCRESLGELQEKDALFTEEIAFVFVTLHAVEQYRAGRIHLTLHTPIRAIRGVNCLHRKFVSWRLHLQSAHKLPRLKSVYALSVENSSLQRLVNPFKDDLSLSYVDLCILIDLAIHFPHVERLRCKLNAGDVWTADYASPLTNGYIIDYAGPCRDSRHDFGKALLCATLPTALGKVQLDFLCPLERTNRIDQTVQVPDLVSPATYDPFNSSLRLLSYQLQELELKVVADASLFWPADGAAAWPNLKSLYVAFHPSTPSGRWYFAGPHGDGRDTKGTNITEHSYPPLTDSYKDKALDEVADEFGYFIPRHITDQKLGVTSNDGILVPFLTAFAKAASNMPVREEAYL